MSALKNIIKIIDKKDYKMGDLLKTDNWAITGDIELDDDKYSKNNDHTKTSIYEAIHMMVINNVNAVIVDDPVHGKIWMLGDKDFSSPKVTTHITSNEEEYLNNCYNFINTKKYILNPKLYQKKLFPEIIQDINSLPKLGEMKGGNNIEAIINTIKISNMTGGNLSYVSDSFDTLNIIERLEDKNIYLGEEEKDRLKTLIAKHSKYTENLNNINHHLKNLYNVAVDDVDEIQNNRDITDITDKFKQKIAKQKKISFKLIDMIEEKLGLSKKNTHSYKVYEKNLTKFSYNHVESMLTKEFTLVEDRKKQKIIDSHDKDISDKIDALTRKVDSLSDLSELEEGFKTLKDLTDSIESGL